MARPCHDQTQSPTETIRLRLASLAEAFERFDPAPLGQRRLATEVMNYILQRAEEALPDRPFRIDVHLNEGPSDAAQASILTDAVQSCFHLQSD